MKAVLYAPAGKVPEAAERLGEELEVREISDLKQVSDREVPGTLLVDCGLVANTEGGVGLADLPPVAVVSLDDEAARAADEAGRHFLSLEGVEEPDRVLRMLRAAMEHAVVLHGADRARQTLSDTREELRELNRVGMALMSERDPDRLLDLILTQARRLTSSDAGSLYLLEPGDDPGPEDDYLRFRLTQNDSLPDLPAPDFTLPIDDKSMAGYVALTGEPVVIEDAYELPESVPFTFYRGFDEEHGYRAKSMLAVAMKDHRDRTVGVLQLINRRRPIPGAIRNDEDANRIVLPYEERDVELVQSLAGQAAVSIENGQLYRSIEDLFEGFIKAAVTAIDQRDPTTSGHSVRVATLTCDLAESADRADGGEFKDVSFTREQMKELRYAGLLHDFGKVGVREQVLVKSKKLPPVMEERIESRFDLIRRTLEVGYQERRATLLMTRGAEAAQELLDHLKKQYREDIARVDRYQRAVHEANEPRVLPEEASGILKEIATNQFPDIRGELVPYLSPQELHFLSIPKGSLDPDERKQIESHVSLTYQFLQQIPWTEDLSRVAEIAHGHHEKLDGTGYPLGITLPEIPLQTRMMTVSDIFDALTASDRPYKKALSSDRAISILDMEAKGGQLDTGIVQLLIESGVYQRVLEEDWREF